VAAVSLKDVDAALIEIDRAIGELGAVGVQTYTNIDGYPLDDPKFAPFFARMAHHDRPIWLHPTRTAAMSDYRAEEKSRFEMWWCFGWPYDTSVAMARLVFAGMFDRHPGLKVITHHLGGMVPYFDGRVGAGLDVLGSRTKDEDYSNILPSLKKPHLDYFRMFYADTAMFGSGKALKLGLDFFGSEHVLFSTDAPLGPIKKTIDALREQGVDEKTMTAIMGGNARQMLRLP
jgi:predicted TIM-barrel fold metal-dependent hydrolase